MTISDPTKSTQNNEGLHDGAEILLTAFGKCPVAVSVHRWSDGAIVDVNEAFSDLTGWGRDRVIGRTMVDLNIVNVETAGGFREHIEKHKTLDKVETDITTLGGAIRTVLVGTVLVDISGEQHALVTFVDITERTRIEDERRQTFERISEAIVALDNDWNYTYVNAKAGEMFGRSADDLIGKHIWTEFPDGVGQKFHLAYEKAKADHEPVFLEEYYPPFDRWFENRIYPSADGLTIYFHDITDRKRAEEAARREHDFSEAILDSLPGIFYCYDENLKFERWNKNFELVTGYSSKEIARMSPLDFFASPERELVATRIQEVFDKGISEVEADFVSKDGTRTPYYFNGLATHIDGRRHLVGVGIDITARKRVEDEVKSHQRLLETVVNHIPAAVSLLRGSDLRLKLINPAYQSIGPGKEMVGKTWNELWPETGQDFAAICRSVLETGEPHEVVDELNTISRTPEGPLETAYFSWSLHRVPLPGDEGWGLLGTAWETTGRVQAESALREGSARLRLSVEAANVGLWDWDLKTNQVYFSPEWKSQIGYRDDELPNDFSEWESHLHPDDLETARDEVRAFLANPHGRHEAEFRFRHKDGSYRWIYTQADVLRDADDKPVRMLGCHIDITERKQAEMELRESEERFAKAFHSGPMAMSVSTLAEGRFTDVNDAFLQMFGFERQEVLGRTSTELKMWFDPIDRAELAAVLSQQGGFNNAERMFPKRNGQVGWALCAAELVELKGEPCVVSLFSDITERRQAEVELKSSRDGLRALSARLDSAREEEGKRIAREIHDELGGALTGLKWDIEGIDQALSGTTDVDDIPSVREKLPVVTGLIDSTIDTVRRISSELRPGVLDDLGLAAAIESQAGQFEARTKIKCRFTSNTDAADLGRERATAVFRIFQEILTNVIRHAQATKVDVKLKESRGYLELKVKDNGRGITDNEKNGTKSLGLLGMNERALLVGGDVSINGAPGKGTTVVVRVPAGRD